MIMNNKRLGLKILVIAFFAVVLYGCGFHLRGLNQPLPKYMENVYIDYNGNDYRFINDLKSALSATGAKVADNANNADAVLKINDVNQSSRLIGISGGASSNQYALSVIVNYSVLTRDLAPVTDNIIAQASQSYNTNATQQLSDNTQKQQIYQSLSTQVSSDIVNQLAQLPGDKFKPAASKSGTTPADGSVSDHRQ
ncbi:MAG: LPS assembly lipoprotein LptE [Francisellaceae bacterium]